MKLLSFIIFALSFLGSTFFSVNLFADDQSDAAAYDEMDGSAGNLSEAEQAGQMLRLMNTAVTEDVDLDKLTQYPVGWATTKGIIRKGSYFRVVTDDLGKLVVSFEQKIDISKLKAVATPTKVGKIDSRYRLVKDLELTPEPLAEGFKLYATLKPTTELRSTPIKGENKTTIQVFLFLEGKDAVIFRSKTNLP